MDTLIPICDESNKKEMSESEIKSRIFTLETEIEMNRAEIYEMENEIEELEDRLDKVIK